MIVAADTSPINYLVLVSQADVLPRLYSEVVIQPAVSSELRSPSTPAAVRRWLEAVHSWLRVVDEVPDALAEVSDRFGVRGPLPGAEVTKAADLNGEIRATSFPGVLDQLEQVHFRMAPRLKQALIDRHLQRRGL